MTEERRGHQLVTASIVAAAVAFAAAFWPFAAGRLFLYGDLGNFHLPLRMFWAETVSNGSSALWLPNLFGGLYLHGEGQLGMYHPLHWFLYTYLPVQPAFALEIMLTYPFAGFGMFWFLRRLELPAAAAAFGGLSFALSGFLMIRLTHPNVIAVIAHIPWLLGALDAATSGRDARARAFGWIGIAALVASQALLGYPGAIAYSLLLLGLYATFVCVRQRRISPLAWLAAAVSLGLLLGAVQLVPTLESFALSYRENSSFEFRMRDSLHPANLVQILVPYAFSHRVFDPVLPNPVELSFYFGSITPIVAIWIFMIRKGLGALRGFVTAVTGACIVALVLALGQYAGLYSLLSELPFVGQLRVPARFSLLPYIAASIFAGIAFADLVRDPSTRSSREQLERIRCARWVWAAPALALIFATTITFVGNPDGPPGLTSAFAAAERVWLGPALSLICAGLFFAAARGARIAMLGLVLFVAIDQAAYGVSQWWSVAPKTLDEYVASVPALPAPPSSRVAAAYTVAMYVDADGELAFHSTTPFIVHDVRLLRGYVGLIPKRHLSPTSPKTMQVAAVSLRQDGNDLVPFPNPLPRFRFVSIAQTSATPGSDIQKIDVAQVALVNAPVDLDPGAAGEILAERERPGEILLSVSTPSRQLLVISETFHEGWRVSIDGAGVKLLRAYGDFMAVTVAAGHHEVALRFEPRSLSQGRALSTAGLLAIAVALFAAFRLETTPNEPGDPDHPFRAEA